ncbi:MAG: cyclic nucleotide-binding domain-containing protein, partial [Candidatus Omnitrophota bacterium]
MNQGDFVMRQGEPADAFYLVYQGALHAASDGRDLADISGGQVVGEMAYFDVEKRRNATVRVASKTATVIKVPYATLDVIFAKRPLLRELFRHLQGPRQLVRKQLLEVGEKGLGATDSREFGRQITQWVNELLKIVSQVLAEERGYDLNHFAVATYGSLARGEELVYASDVDFRVIPQAAKFSEHARYLDEAIHDVLTRVLGNFSISGLEVDQILKKDYPHLFYMSPDDLKSERGKDLWGPTRDQYIPAIDSVATGLPNEILPTTLRDMNFVAGNKTVFDAFSEIAREKLYDQAARPMFEKAFLGRLDEMATQMRGLSGQQDFVRRFNIKEHGARAIQYFVWRERSRFSGDPELRDAQSPFEFIDKLSAEGKLSAEDAAKLNAAFSTILRLRNILHLISIDEGRPDAHILTLGVQNFAKAAQRSGMSEAEFERTIREQMASLYQVLGGYFGIADFNEAAKNLTTGAPASPAGARLALQQQKQKLEDMALAKE